MYRKDRDEKELELIDQHLSQNPYLVEISPAEHGGLLDKDGNRIDDDPFIDRLIKEYRIREHTVRGKKRYRPEQRSIGINKSGKWIVKSEWVRLSHVYFILGIPVESDEKVEYTSMQRVIKVIEYYNNREKDWNSAKYHTYKEDDWSDY